MWGQIVIGVLLVSVIAGPIIEATESTADPETVAEDTVAVTDKVNTTMTAVSISTAGPVTSAPSIDPTVPSTTSPPSTDSLTTTTPTPVTTAVPTTGPQPSTEQQPSTTLDQPGTGLNPSRVSRSDFGDDWPFTVETGLLRCEEIPDTDVAAVIFGTDEAIYALNGTALARAEQRGWEPLDAIWADSSAIPGTKKNIGPVIDLGLSLCR